MTDLELITGLINEHFDLLKRFWGTCSDLRETDPDEELELFGQIMDYRSKMQDKMEAVFQKIQDLRSKIPETDFDNLTAENDRLLQEIIELDRQNESRLRQYQQHIFAELKQTAINTKAITGYQAPNLVNKRIITDV